MVGLIILAASVLYLALLVTVTRAAYQRSQNDLIVTINDMNEKEWRMAA